nr:hypothetical protein [candidate division Zixibacteria bacterium]
MKSFFLGIIICLTALTVSGQEKPDSVLEREGLDRIMSLLNLKLSDISFRDDYTEKDQFRLTAVADMMKAPYGMIKYSEEALKICRGGKLKDILNYAFDRLERENQSQYVREIRQPVAEINPDGINLFYNSIEFNRLLMKARAYLGDIQQASYDSTFLALTRSQRLFLINQYKEIMSEDTADVNKPVDVLDSIQQVEEGYIREFVEFGGGVRKDFMLSMGLNMALDIYNEIDLLLKEINSGQLTIENILTDTSVIPERAGIARYLGKDETWIIGGPGDDYYQGEYQFIFDFGGNDHYDLWYNPVSPHGTIIIDLSGDDIYTSQTDFTLGSGCLSVGLLYDFQGDDIYNAGSFSCGSGYFGFGLLYDASGSDKYYGDTHTQGAGTFGAGLLIDRGGSDLYSAALFGQGFGGVEGFGLVADYAGNDNYLAGGKYTETYGLAGGNVHYLSLSQGFGQGLRPYTSGGVGMILDYGGNDNYIADIFAQGSSYWWGLGIIGDAAGNDQYVAYQYAQGAGIHMSVGILADFDGDDFYRGKGLMHGCGHDYGCGLMLDRSGQDIFQAEDLSQAAGSANGIGILINTRGDDTYYVRSDANTQGYGNPRREFGSIGLFVDLAGRDRYTGQGGDSTYWISPSKWGGGIDQDFITPVISEGEAAR